MKTEADRLHHRFSVLDRMEVPDLTVDVDRHIRDPIPHDADDRRPIGRLLVPLLLAFVAIVVAIGGFVWLRSGFRTVDRRPPAEEAGANYVFSDVRVDPARTDEGKVSLRFRVSWSTDAYPGVHRCVFRALDAQGTVVSELVQNTFAMPETEGRGEGGVLLPRPSGDTASGEAACDQVRLDTPGIAELEPLDPALAHGVMNQEIGLDELFAEYERRTDAWAERFQIDSMTVEQLAATLAALDYQGTTLFLSNLPSKEVGLATWELDIRELRLCELVPRDDPIYREFNCSRKGPASLSD